jgi:hypothetical protein
VPILWQGGYTNRGAGKMVSIRYTFRIEQEKVPPKGVFVVIAYEEIYIKKVLQWRVCVTEAHAGWDSILEGYRSCSAVTEML